MKIYKEELSLAGLIEANTSIAYCLELNKPELQSLEFTKAKLDGTKSRDLFPVYSILVSSVWNENDDVFTSANVWASRSTPKNHPSNINHDQLDIVGHITDIWVVDSEMNLVAEDTSPEDLPELIHIINEAVIYTHFTDAEQMTKVFNLIEEIEAGKKYVSMEATFSDFDYALIDPEGKNHVIPRNEESAFLTKHLRAYGGTGVYQDHKIGRVLKAFTFVGKGYVDNPANKASVILKGKPFVAASNTSNIELNGVLSNNELLEKKNMSIELEKQVEALKAENEALKEKALSSVTVELQKQIADLTAAMEVIEANLVKEKEAIQAAGLVSDALKANKIELEAKLAEAEKVAKEASDSLEAIKAEKVAVIRTAKLIAASFSEEDAKATVQKYVNLNDEQWEDISALLVSAKKSTGAGDQEEEIPGETSFSFNFSTDDKSGEDQKVKLEALQSSVASIFKSKEKTNA